MNKLTRIVLLLAVLVVAGLAVVLPTQGRPTGLIISNSDGTNEIGFQPSSGLQAIVDKVGARLVVQFANGSVRHALDPVPAPLAARLAQVAPRLAVQFANGNETHQLVGPPSSLSAKLNAVRARIRFEFANGNSQMNLAYPLELVNDTRPPVVSNVSSQSLAGGRLLVRWNTDEYTDSVVRFGSASGAYSETVTDALLVKEHELILTGLTPGQTVYFRISATDRSGNAVQTAEYLATVTDRFGLYLPVVQAP